MKKVLVFASLVMMAMGVFGQTKVTDSAKTKVIDTLVKKADTAKKPLDTIKTVPYTSSKEQLVEITTNMGVMVAKLYNSTPKHRDNFIAKIKAGFYDSLLFHRIIREFMIQGGDPQSRTAPDSVPLGSGSAPGDRIPAEFNPNFFHKKGALAAARDGNPEKASSNCQFYIVQGKKVDTAQLRQANAQINKDGNPKFHYSKAQKEIYERIGGTPHLDQNYTVFGEVISGLDVIDRITSIPTKPGDRPIMKVWMKIKLIN